MKLRILTAFVVCFCFTVLLSSKVTAAAQEDTSKAATVQQQEEDTNSWCAVKFSVWPGVVSLPFESKSSEVDWYFLNFGLVTFGAENQEIDGVDAGLFLSTTNNVNGLQISPTVFSDNPMGSTGAKIGFFGTFARNFSGFQLAILNDTITSKRLTQVGMGNVAKDSTDVFQVGLIDTSINSQSFQIGLLCMNDKGFLPVFPFINFTI